MSRENQISIDGDRGTFLCLPCNKLAFMSEDSLLQHCRSAGAHAAEWCERCKWLFVSSTALSDHLRDSSNHWICEFCDTDEAEEDDLVNHQAKKHSYCYDCETTFANYSEHIFESHHRCDDCDREFDHENELKMVCQIN